jgi:pimeloyl-ACP methyl ester carboxylesterase
MPRMPVVSLDGIELCYETSGDAASPPMLLIGGLGMQLVGWGADWVAALVGRGYYAVTFDNRDAGLSTHLVERGVPDLLRWLWGEDANIAYGLSDMAKDAAGLLEYLGMESAHVVGISMGGMIAQQLALDHPSKVRSLASIMSTTGDPAVGQPSKDAAEALLELKASTREEAVEMATKVFAIIGSPAFPPDEDRLRRMAGEAFDRSHEPTGIARQLGAIVSSPDRTPRLATVSVPTLVVHGSADPLVDPSGGRATAQAIPGAKLVMIEGMGHDLPEQIWPQLLDEIDANARRGEAGGASVSPPP